MAQQLSVAKARPFAVLDGRFRVDTLLKTGGGADTFLAEDLYTGDPAVIKRVATGAVGDAYAMRLRHEASVLSRLAGPDGSPLLIAHGPENGSLWLAQRFVPGEPLDRRLIRGPLGVDETLRVAAGVLATLAAAHASGITHRDVKPANIIVHGAGGGAGGAVTGATLVDFGLSRSALLDPAIRDQAVGTARYCPPEQAGLIEVPVDERSDLYALGAVLFECLAGRPLFGGERIGNVLRQHLSQAVPDLTTTRRGVPRALASLLSRLLRKHPDDRYQSAAAVLADVEAIVAARAAGVKDPAMVIGRHDRRRHLAEPGFVGRQAELDFLLGRLEATVAGDGGLVLLAGDSGGGKTRLLDELARLAGDRGVSVLRGQAEDQTARRPFQLFEGVAAGLAEAAGEQPELAGALRRRLGDAAGALVAAVPRLSDVVGADAVTGLPEEYGESRSVRALAAMLDAAGSRFRPVLVLLDDCQWAPTVTARVLAEWTGSAPARRWTMTVAAYRAEEVDASSPLRAIGAVPTVRLGPIGDSEVADLVSSMAGPLPDEALDAVVRLSDGSPFMAQAVLRGMVESDALVADDQGWRVDSDALRSVQTSRRAALFLVRRLELLSPAGQSLLGAAAVLGKEFDLALAVALCGITDEEAVTAIDECRRRRILWVADAAGRGRFLHDKLREAALARLGSHERAFLHLRAARRLAEDGAAGCFELAYHFDAAGCPAEALAPALAAAEQARAQHALDGAEFYYRIAERAAADAGTRGRVAEGLGEVLALAGRYDEAEAALAEAAALADNISQRAVLEGKIGEVAFRRGDQARAVGRLEGALRQMGHWVPRWAPARAAAAVWEIAVQAAHTVAPGLVRRRRGPPGADDRLAMRFYSRLAYAYWFRNGKVACLWAHLREMNWAERYPPSAQLAQAYSEHAPAMTILPWYGRGITYVKRSYDIRCQLGDAWGQGQSLSFYGVALYSASRYRECIEACEEASRILGRTGDRWERNTARWHIAFALYRLGQHDRAVAVAAEVHRDAIAIGDHASAGIALSVWSRASGGAVPAAAIAEAGERVYEDVHTLTEVKLAEAVRLLGAGDPAGAAAVLERAWAAVKEAGLRQEYVAPILPWWATALRSQLEVLPAGEPSRRALEAKAARIARRSRRLARLYRNNLPHALREEALICARRGKISRARRLLDRSLTIARHQHAAWEEARSRYDRGRVGAITGWEGAAVDMREGSESLAAIGERVTGGTKGASLSLADRFATLLATGRGLAAASSPAAIYEAVRDATVELLRAERCHVIEIPDDAGRYSTTVSGEHVDGLSASLVRRAVESGQVVVSTPETDGVSESLVLSDMRSVLCAPIVAEGRTVACFYAVHGEVAGLFGEEEEQLATFIATLAGAAVEHAAGSAAHFRALVQNAYDITLVCDEAGLIHYVSPSVNRVLGREPSELLGTTGAFLVHPEDAATLMAGFAQVVAYPGGRHTCEVRARHRDGSWRWLEYDHTNMLGDPAIAGVVVNVRDTTERKKAEQGQARASNEFKVAFDSAPIGMALTSVRSGDAGRILRVNGAMAEMLGTPLEELVGRSMRDFIHPEDVLADAAVTERFQHGDQAAVEGEKRYRRADGRWIWVRVTAAMITDEQGQPDYVIRQVVDVTERRAAEERLAYQASHDPLTGLPNRRFFLDRLAHAVGGRRRRDTRLAVLYLDLDRFKAINDSFGHATGDKVLVETARRLSSLKREGDVLARLGGDEFVLLVDGLEDPDEVHAVANRVAAALRIPFTVAASVTVSVSTSIGIVFAGGGRDGLALLRDADAALYRAKERGRACYELFGEHLRNRALGRMRAEADLREAMDADRLVLRYQPIVHLPTGKVVGTEALLRYQDPDGHLVGPGEFIAVAEETGLIAPLTTWVLREACAQLARWQAATGDPTFRVAVNVSPRQLLGRSFADLVAEVVSRAGIDPATLALEVTETALMESIQASRPCLERIRAAGCQVGIDDFGTGYASLTSLRQLPIDFLKIDRSFVSGLGVDREDTTIVSNVVGLAGALGLASVAEGVETAAQEQALRGMGCSYAQGYRLGGPVPAESIRLATGTSAGGNGQLS